MQDFFFKKVLPSLEKALSVLIDFLFPRKEGAKLYASLPTHALATKLEPSESKEALYSYHNLIVHSLVWHAKYQGDPLAINIMGELMHDALFEAVSELVAWHGGKKALLLPIPESKKRRKEKGFNQVALIAKSIVTLSSELFELNTTTLIRKKEVARQTDLKKRTERLTNMKGVFFVTEPKVLEGRVIVLIDDVTTTGATLQEAKAVLQKAKPAYIHTLAFAH